MTTNKALSRRPAATAGNLNTLVRASLGGALLMLTAACSADMGASADWSEDELADDGAVLTDVSEPTVDDPSSPVEKATFNDFATYQGFDVKCDDTQKRLIREAEARAVEILAIAGPATAEARVNRSTSLARTFRIYFAPTGTETPDPNRGSPDEIDIAVFRVAQKLVGVSRVLASADHTCHGEDEFVGFFDGAYRTCGERPGLAAATEFTGAPVRWCNEGLSKSLDERAITLIHELTHQDRTADATGEHVYDDSETAGPIYNAHNYSTWLRNVL